MVSFTKLTNHIKLHMHKQPLSAELSGILAGLSHNQLSGQKALLKCLSIADTFNVTDKWEKKAHILESSVYASLYKKSILHYDTSDKSKNRDRLAWYYLRKNKEPFIAITNTWNWTPIKNESTYDKAVIALKNLIDNS